MRNSGNWLDVLGFTRLAQSTWVSWIVFFLLVVLQGCLNKDSELEHTLAKKLIQHKTDSVLSIDLRTVFGTRWKKICLQGPYMLQTHFEKLAGENVRDYEGISDDRYTFWVFYTDDHTSRVEIERIKVMDHRGGGTGCTSFQQPFLYFDVEGVEKKYFFNNTGDMK